MKQTIEQTAIFLPNWWSWLDQLSIDEQGYDAGDVLCAPVSEKWVDANRTVHISEESLFPAQHFIWTPVNLEKGGTGKLVSLYEYLGTDGIRLNIEYLSTWRAWKAREVSSDNLLPERLKKLFVDPHGAIIDEIDIEDMEEAEAKCFLEEQTSLFEKHMGWSPHD